MGELQHPSTPSFVPAAMSNRSQGDPSVLKKPESFEQHAWGIPGSFSCRILNGCSSVCDSSSILDKGHGRRFVRLLLGLRSSHDSLTVRPSVTGERRRARLDGSVSDTDPDGTSPDSFSLLDSDGDNWSLVPGEVFALVIADSTGAPNCWVTQRVAVSSWFNDAVGSTE